MTSPNLPFVYTGLIWDGVTEYLNTIPAGIGTVYILRMIGDGSRRYTEYQGTNRPMDILRRFSTQDDVWETMGVTYENGAVSLVEHGIGYMDYDGSTGPEPVNQIPYLQAFRTHAARFAHQLDAGMGVHTLLSAEERDRLIILNANTDLIGNAWHRYEAWKAVDPEERIIGGNNDGTLLWKHGLPDMQEVDRILCGQCGQAQFAQLIYEYADLPAMRRNYRDNGLVYSLDRSTTPWSPVLFDVAPGSPPFVDYYESLDAGYKTARLHYYHTVGASDIADG